MKIPRQPNPALDESFEAFWAVYPRKDARKDARKAWDQLHPDTPLVGRILSDLARRAWPNDPCYILLPATYLRGERWNDQHSMGHQSGMPTYPDADWCHHHPRCNSHEWHALLLARESTDDPSHV